MAAIKSRREPKPPGAPPKVKTTGAVLSQAKLPPSFQKPSVSSALSTNQHDYGPSPAVTGSTPSAVGGEEELLSEAQQQLQRLLAKQLDTSQDSLESALSGCREFTPAVVYQPLTKEMRGLNTLSQFIAKEKEVGKVDRLRQLGLTKKEIELKLQESGEDNFLPGPVKKRNLGADPTAQQDRIDAVNQKILEREKMLDEPVKYRGVKQMSRHAMAVERSLFSGSDWGNPLDHLTREERGTHEMAYPKCIMPVTSSSEAPPSTVAVTSLSEAPPSTVDHALPTQLPVQVIERNRLSEAEIRALPRFTDYSPGKPSKVLFLKNMNSGVSTDDLRALFGGDSSSGPHIRLMTGRMKGQAFVSFDSIEAATKALQLINGYKIRDRPIIISFGHSN